MPSSASKSSEPIAGYTLTERIGAGGYGEVWKAEAPGGLTKAIKFVFGQLDDVRAASEFQALSRIKQVRHPFLLSLERIEVVDGQLVIVTELADASFRDRHEECRQSGRSGIPRRELLECLRDVAEALDYMSERFGLQHLDVKPENLLLVGGRAKVADFGLVQDIGSQRQAKVPLEEGGDVRGADNCYTSIPAIGGFTPLYASPEVFRGRPSVHSDQYSLAIVYQELLTGVLPFPGCTASQLATQHVNGHPQLASLPPEDRPAIARALDKDPEARFPSCSALVSDLMGPDRRSVSSLPPAEGAAPAAPRRHADTGAVSCHTSETGIEPCPARARPGAEPERSSESAPEALPQPRPGPVVDLEPPECPLEEPRLRPTLWLGIGGTGATILRQLRRRLADRFGDLGSMPALRTLLLDTDSKAVAAALQGDAESAFDAQDTIAAPLRQVQHYRNHSQRHLQWLSRRWLYNIPRSLRTDGFRPIGRLAFTDHASTIAEQVRAALASLAQPESLAATTKTTGLAFRDEAPRVFVVASISGGTGSGMLFDACALVRRALRELAIPEAEVCALLTHATGRDPQRRDLAVANAYACLKEWQYFHREGRRGDETPCFEHTYLVHLGDGLDDADLAAAADDVAAYLNLDVATAAGAFFDACRQNSPPKAALRTFGLSQTGCAHGPTLDLCADTLARYVLEIWRAGNDRSDRPAQASTAEQAAAPADGTSESDGREPAVDDLQDLFVELDSLIEEAQQAAVGQLNVGSDQGVADLLDAVFRRAARGESSEEKQVPADRVLQCLNELLGARDPRHGQPSDEFHHAMAAQLKQSADDRAAAVDLRLWQLAKTPGVRISGAREAAQRLADHFGNLLEEIRQYAEQANQGLAGTETALLSAKQKTRRAWWLPFPSGNASAQAAAHQQQWAEYLRLRLLLAALQAASRSVQSLRSRALETARDLDDAARRLGQLEAEFPGGEPTPGAEGAERLADETTGPLCSTISRELRDRLPELAIHLDHQFQPRFVEHLDRLRRAAPGDCGSTAALAAALRRAARATVLQSLSQANPLENVLLSATADQQPGGGGGLELGSPALLDHGGARRLLLATPPGAVDPTQQKQLEQRLGAPLVSMPHATGDVVLCCEAEQIDPVNAAAILLGQRRPCLQMASRLHTRIDIAWDQ